MTKDSLASLTQCYEEYLYIRNRYINEIHEKYSFRQEGDCIIVNIPDLDLQTERTTYNDDRNMNRNCRELEAYLII